MGELAFAMQEAGEFGTTVDKERALEKLSTDEATAKELLYLSASATLLDTNDDTVRFVHQLLQEYFAASAWQRRLPSDDLTRYWPDDWTTPSGWEETAILLAGMLPDMSAMSTLVDRLREVNPVLAARCIAESGGLRPSDTAVDALRGHLTEIATSLYWPTGCRSEAGNALNAVNDRRPGIGLDSNGLPDIVWCEVPAGDFLMGPKKTPYTVQKGKLPQLKLFLPQFHISKFPITNAQYEAFIDDGGYTDLWQPSWTKAGWQWRKHQDITTPLRFQGVFGLPNHPVVGVSWYEAVAFCNWLTRRLGRRVQLPSEAQWEKAARGADGRSYPWGDYISTGHVNYQDTNIRATSAVGIFPLGESPYNALDMAGNVWEWTSSVYPGYKSYTDAANEDPDALGLRSLRGGSWSHNVRCARCAYRGNFIPDYVGDNCGFRVVSLGAVGR